jgi:Domain of unknown function (DUF5011)
MKSVLVSFASFASITSLSLLSLLPTGCAAPPSAESQVAERALSREARAPELAPGRASSRASAEALAARARLAASGERSVRSQRELAPTIATTWGDALDLPEAIVGAATVDGPAQAAAIRGSLGIITPRLGPSFVLLSTGYADPAATNPHVEAEPGTDFDEIGTAGDAVTLHLTLQVPAGANRMALQYNFLSSESPDFLQTDFNDTFSIQLIDDEIERPVEALASVNTSEFFDSSESRADGTGYDLYTANPNDIDTVFGDVGLPDAGLTDFQSFHAAVTPGSQLEVLLTIADNGDGILDSAVLIDALQFSAIETLDPNPQLPVVNGALTATSSDLATKGRAVRGAVADGETVVLLRTKVAEAGTVTFSILSGASDGELSKIDGVPVVGQSVDVDTFELANEHYAVALYRAPADFNGPAAQKERTISIAAGFPAGPGALVTQIDFQLRRPPVVMAHGLWSSSLDWLRRNADQSLKFPLTQNPAFEITYADRNYSCNAELRTLRPATNLFVCPLAPAAPGEGEPLCLPPPLNPIGAATLEALSKIRRLGIAATQVDVVAHGAAGVHVRQYLDTATYKNPLNLGKGDVNRLITINTPHRGSEVAALTLQGRDTATAPPEEPNRDYFMCSARILSESPVEPGDIDALAPATLRLAASGVPGHAIVGTARSINAQVMKLKVGAASKLYDDIQVRRLDPTKILIRPGSAAFGGTQHDLFSTITSQQGGLAGTQVSSFTMTYVEEDPVGQVDSDFFHSMGESDISARIEALLDSPTGGASFGAFTATVPPPPALSPFSLEAPASPPKMLASGRLRIVSPLFGADVVAGSTLDVVVVAEGGFVPQSIAVMTKGELTNVPTPGSGPFSISLKIPADALGPIRLLAVGTDAAEDSAYSNDVALIARTTATLTGVSIVTQDPYLFGAGARRQLSVLGRYNDGVTRNITESTAGTIYRSSNPGVVDVTPQGMLIALGTGIATVSAQNGLSQDSVTVTVKLNTAPLAVASGGTSLTCLPPGAQAEVQLDGSASFDLDGDALTYAWQEGGVVLATGPTPTLQLGPGEHTIELQVADGEGGFASASVAVSVALDSAPPALAVAGDDPATLECGGTYSDAGATALDACDGDLTDAIVAQSNVETGTPGSYAVSYLVHDQANLSSTASRAVLVQDTTAPQLTLLGADPQAVQCGTAFTDPGATAADSCAGDLTSAVTAQSNVNSSVPGSYAVSYRVQDPTGLSATRARGVVVQDSEAPLLTVLGDNPKVVECGLPYSDAGATATDRCDGDLTSAITSQSNVNPRVPGAYAVSYQVLDHAGLSASASRAVAVADRTPPQVVIAPMIQLAPPILIYRSFDLSDCASAVDSCGGPVDIDQLGAIVAIHSDEPDRSFFWDPARDIVITGASSFKLRQQRNFPGNGRVYEIEFTVRDERGNRGPVQSCFVGVKTLRRSPTPINDGRIFTVLPHTP